VPDGFVRVPILSAILRQALQPHDARESPHSSLIQDRLHLFHLLTLDHDERRELVPLPLQHMRKSLWQAGVFEKSQDTAFAPRGAQRTQGFPPRVCDLLNGRGRYLKPDTISGLEESSILI